MNHIHQHIAPIFEILSKGQFICSNSSNRSMQTLYNVISQEGNFEELFDYFKQINFCLEAGDEYYYFSREESKAGLERKIEAAHQWIDLLDFFKTYDQAFGVGWRFNPADIRVKLSTNAELKYKLDHLKKRYPKNTSYDDAVGKLAGVLRKEGFLEIHNEIEKTYKVLSSFKYLEELILKINIEEDIENEIPE